LEPRASTSSIGEGAYGIVYKALDTWNNKPVALKKIKLETEVDGISSSTLREITLLMHLIHKNIVKLENVWMDRDRMSLIFELLEIDLRKYLDRQKAPLNLEIVRVSFFNESLIF
jgi:cyclin-dependent kinase